MNLLAYNIGQQYQRNEWRNKDKVADFGGIGRQLHRLQPKHKRDPHFKQAHVTDGEPALPNLLRRAVRGPVTHILDWWHISMRVKHIENAVQGLLQSKDISGHCQVVCRV